MSEKAHDLSALILAMFAAVPLYATQTISLLPLLAYHGVMLAMAIRVAAGKGPEVIPAKVMRALAVAYILFYIVDAVAVSRSAIAASTHLVLFIAVYQPIEALRRRNDAQRLLTTALIFTASVATATHVTILPFVIVFGFLLFRQLMHVAHTDALLAAGATAPEPPSGRAALFYLCGATLIGALLFPMLPRVRNPIVPGLAASLNNASTGLSDTINLNDQRAISADASVVSRIWMGQEAVPFFTPLRLRGAVYDRFNNNTWLQARREFLPLDMHETASVRIARPGGFTRRATVQQRFIVGSRLFLPVGTYEIDGVPQVYEGPTRDVYMAGSPRRDLLSYEVQLAHEVAPLRVRRIPVTNYPVTPPVAAMAQRIVGSHTDPMVQAADIERYLSTNFRYVPDPSKIGRRMTVDDFLLREHRGHCEYFAAGMVALMSSLGTPARIAGGFYGGKLNPLTGYFVVRREDAHAWVEVFDGAAWQTFDPTPASLRPGNEQSGLVRMYAAALGESINYFWDRYVLTFGLADQISLAIDAIGRSRDTLLAMKRGARHAAAQLLSARAAMLLVSALLALAVILLVRRHRRPAFALLRDHLARRGIDVGPAMTMEEALAELAATHPADAVALEPLMALYEAERFSASPLPNARMRIRAGLRALTP